MNWIGYSSSIQYFRLGHYFLDIQYEFKQAPNICPPPVNFWQPREGRGYRGCQHRDQHTMPAMDIDPNYLKGRACDGPS